MSEQRRRLHPLSSIFLLGSAARPIALPLAAMLFLGRGTNNWEAWAAVAGVGFGAWTVLRARYFHYEVGESELLVREGVIDRSQKHIPFARIQGVSQRRQLLHRLLGVTEVRIESAAGGKPEAVMKVLSLRAAAELESLLRGKKDAAPATPVTHSAPAAARASPILHTLPAPEILRLGLVSNRGMVMLGVLFGLVMQNETLRSSFGQLLQPLARWAGRLMQTQVESGHAWLLAGAAASGLLGMLLLLRLLSVALAFLRYHKFTLTRDGERLLAQQGLLTVVRHGARLPRLQRWELEETWLHRRFKRCRLAVSVAGSSHGHGHEHGASPETGFDELAPIATPAQAQALLRACIPALDWDRLHWRALHPAAARRRLFGQARWVVPVLSACAWADFLYAWPLPWPALAAGYALLALAMLWHARAWARFAAIAEYGDVLLYRSGVLTRRTIVVVEARLQNVRLYSSPLDRSLGIAHLQADTQGGSRHHRALDIPCLGRGAAETLRASLWRRIQSSAG